MVAHMMGALPASWESCREHLSKNVRRHVLYDEWAIINTLDDMAPFLAVGAGCSEVGLVRIPPKEEWKSFAMAYLDELGSLPWIFLGNDDDREISETIGRTILDALGKERFRYKNLCGAFSLAASITILKRAEQYLGVDSALLHVARLINTKSVSFWGPTDPSTLLRPIEGHRDEILYRPPICSPCIHVAEEPPCKGENICMSLFSESKMPSAMWYEDTRGVSRRVKE
jgi:ADP-heptose:LPS heptosyltransferase